MILYVNTQGAKVKTSENRIVVEAEKKVLSSTPVHSVKSIVILGNVTVTTPVITLCLSLDIVIIFATYTYLYKGILQSDLSSQPKIRLFQYEVIRDSKLNLAMAKDIVKVKIRNQMILLTKKSRTLEKENLKETLAKLSWLSGMTERVKSISHLFGIEGIASKYYFSNFDKMLSNPYFKFEKRSIRPPRNEVNAMLSFGYGMLVNRLLIYVISFRLDPYLSHLHSVENNRLGLVLDLMEEFRSRIDNLVINIINRYEMNALEDFSKWRNGGIYLNDKGKKKFMAKFEKLCEAEKFGIELRQSVRAYIKKIRELTEGVGDAVFTDV